MSLKRPSPARSLAALSPSPKLRRYALVALVLGALIALLYFAWLRDSSLVAVEQVTVTGLTSRDSDRVRAALTSTARTMTTLNVDRTELEEAASAFPIVQAIEVERDFPHGLAVHVIEHRPVALLDKDGETVPVAGDGTILAGLPVEGELPTIELSGPTPQRQLPQGAARDAAAVAGGAPAVIARRLESVGREGGTRGVVAQVGGGPEIIFGDTRRITAKWAAAVRVLADSEAAGAAYVDVRIPERPVAGGLSVETVEPVAPVGVTDLEPSLPRSEPVIEVPGVSQTDGPAVAPEAELPGPAEEEGPNGGGVQLMSPAE